MSLDTQQYVWEHSKQKGAARLVMVALADNANDIGDAFPGITRIAKRCNMSERNLILIIQKCERESELIVFEQCGIETGNGKTNLYRIVRNDIKQPLPLDEKGVSLVARPIKQPRNRKFSEGVKPVTPPANGVKPVTPLEVKPVTPLEVKPVTPKQSGNNQVTVSGRRKKSNGKDWTSENALISAWVDATDRFGSFDTEYRRNTATDLLVMNCTPEMVTAIVKWKRPNGNTMSYEFGYLAEDLPEYLVIKARETKETERAATAKAKMEETMRINRTLDEQAGVKYAS